MVLIAALMPLFVVAIVFGAYAVRKFHIRFDISLRCCQWVIFDIGFGVLFVVLCT